MDDQDKEPQSEATSSGEEIAYESDWYEVLKRRAYDVIPKQELDAATLRRILRLASLQQETGRALRATEGRFHALLENSAEAVALLDAGGRIEYASASMRRVLGFESHEVAGRLSLEFVHPQDRSAVQAAFLRLQTAPGKPVNPKK